MRLEERPDSGWLVLLRAAALIALAVGAGGSLGFMFRAGQRTPPLLLLGFFFWVVSPFVALAWANIASTRWLLVTRATLYCVTLVVALASLAVYGEVLTVRPADAPNAFLFVIVPPASGIFTAVVLLTAGLVSRRASREST